MPFNFQIFFPMFLIFLFSYFLSLFLCLFLLLWLFFFIIIVIIYHHYYHGICKCRCFILCFYRYRISILTGLFSYPHHTTPCSSSSIFHLFSPLLPFFHASLHFHLFLLILYVFLIFYSFFYRRTTATTGTACSMQSCNRRWRQAISKSENQMRRYGAGRWFSARYG